MMRKFSKVSILTVLCGFIIAACGGKDSPVMESAKKETAAKEAVSERPSGQTEESAGEATPTSGALAVTSIKEAEGRYNIVLNDVLMVKGVEIKEGKNGEFLSFPQRKDGSNWWDYIRVERGEEEGLLKAVKSGGKQTGGQEFKVTDVKVRKFESASGPARAFVEIELNGGLVKLFDWKIVEGKNGLFLGSPSVKEGNDYVDIVHSIDKDFSAMLKDAAIKAYEEK